MSARNVVTLDLLVLVVLKESLVLGAGNIIFFVPVGKGFLMGKMNQWTDRKYRAQRNRAEYEEKMVNMIDARKMFAEALEEIRKIQSSSDYWTNKKKIKQVDIIKTAMWQVWATKELEEGILGSPEGTIDSNMVLPILERAKEDTSRVMQMEISGPDGGPLEMVRRLRKEDLERLAPFTEMIKMEQKERLSPSTMLIEE